MTAAVAVTIAAAGAAGAVLRHELTGDRPLFALHVVNVTGSLLLGLAIGVGLDGLAHAAAIGGLGALTSFSTWMVGAVGLTDGPAAGWRRARTLALHVLAPAGGAVAAAAIGIAVARVATTAVGAS